MYLLQTFPTSDLTLNTLYDYTTLWKSTIKNTTDFSGI